MCIKPVLSLLSHRFNVHLIFRHAYLIFMIRQYMKCFGGYLISNRNKVNNNKQVKNKVGLRTYIANDNLNT